MALVMYRWLSTSPRRPDRDSLNLSLPPSISIDTSAISARFAEWRLRRRKKRRGESSPGALPKREAGDGHATGRKWVEVASPEGPNSARPEDSGTARRSP